MANQDKLVFPIGFDLEGGVKQVEHDWEKTYRKRLQSVIDSKPIKIKLDFDANGVNLKDYKEYIALSKQAAQSAKENALAREAEAKAREREAKATQQASNARVAENTEAERTRRIKAQAALTEEKLTQAKERSARATQSQNSAYATQGAYLQRLVQRMLAYASVTQVMHFLRNIREVTAEFELQRTALGALIGDMHEAGVLFEKIKAAAVKSPFQVKELVTYTKQLAAYKIETEDLFETTQRLADISAGVGVGMERLILAYGQIRATGYLRASEVRQLTEAGIPIVEELAKKMSEFRNETVSAADVMQMISERAISFEQVKEVFDDMTSAGGRFYKMQEIQAETLRGQINNLKDSFAIMYDEIGRGGMVNSIIKSMISLTKRLTQNWEIVGGVIASVVFGFLSLKAGKNIMDMLSLSTTKLQMATRQLTRAKGNLRLAMETGNRAAIMSARTQVRAALLERKAAMATDLHTKAWYKLRAAIASNPLGAILTVITTIISAIVTLTSEIGKLDKELASIGAENELQQNQSVRNFERLAEVVRNSAKGTKEQKDALAELKRAYGDFLPQQDAAIVNLVREKAMYAEVTKAIREKIAWQSKEQKKQRVTSYYSEEMGSAKEQIRKRLKKEGLSREEIAEEFERLNKLAQENVANNTRIFSDGANKMIEVANKFSWVKYTGLINFITSKVSEDKQAMQTYISLLEQYYDDLADIDAEYEASINRFGEYKSIYERLKTWNQGISSEFEVGTFAYDEDVLEKTIDNYKETIKGLWIEAFQEGFIDQDTYNDYADNFDAILDLLEEKVPAMREIIRQLRLEYKDLFPSSEADAVKSSIISVAAATGLSMDKAKRYLMQDGQNIGSWKEQLKTDMAEASKAVLSYRLAWQYASQHNLPVTPDLLSKLNDATQLEEFLKGLDQIWKFSTTGGKGKGGGGKKKDPWIEMMENRMKFMQDFQKGVEKLSKTMELTNAITQEQATMLSRGSYLDIDTSKLSGSSDELIKWYENAIAEVVKKIKTVNKTLAGKTYDTVESILKFKSTHALTKDLQKLLDALYNALTDFKTDSLAKEMEKKMKKLSDDVARTKTAKEFFDNMLGLTGNKQLSASLTLSVYGQTGDNIQQKLVEQVQEAFKGFDLSKSINQSTNDIDLVSLRELYNEALNDPKIAEKTKQNMEKVIKILEDGQKDLANRYSKLLMQFSSDVQKRNDLINKAAADVATIKTGLDLEIKSIKAKKMNYWEESSAIAQAEARATEATNAINAKLELDLEKLEGNYVRFFAAINSMTADEANKIRSELREALFKAFHDGGISADELTKELKAIDAQFKKLNESSSLFATYMTSGFDAMLEKLRQSGDELNAIVVKLAKGGTLEQGEQSFVDKILGIFGEKGEKSFAQLSEKFKGNTQGMADALGEVGDKMQGIFSGAAGAIAIVDMIIKAVHQSIEAIKQVIDQINSMRSEENQIAGWFDYISDFDKYAMSGWEKLKSGDVMGAMADTVSSIISIFQNVQKGKIEKINDSIEEQDKLLEDLQYSYNRTQKALEKSFGADYLKNYNNQLENLQAQYDAYLAQAEAEKSKGKAADSEKIEDYEKQARDAQDAIEDMYGSLSAHFLGADLTSAARDFAQAWIEAYKEFSNTTDAMKEKFQDMIQNMIVESLLAKVMEKALEPVFKMIDNMQKTDFYSPTFWQQVMREMETATQNGVVGAENVMSWLEQMGINIRSLGGEMTGISRDIATASEESILGLAAGINTQNYYISQVPAKMDIIIALLRGEGTMTQGSAITLQDLMTLQNQHLSYLPTIAQHTADTVAECKAIVAETRRTADALERVIKPEGTKAAYKLNTTLS